MGQAYYDVPMTRQEDNPICWLACVSMVLSWDQSASVTIGSLNGGFDPSNSCISNPVTSWADQYHRLESFGLTSESIEACPAPAFVEGLLQEHGPFILTHLVSNFPYGSGRGNGSTADPGATHAVVITGVDTDAGHAWMNNPWGDKDQYLPLDSVLQSMTTLFVRNIRSIAHL